MKVNANIVALGKNCGIDVTGMSIKDARATYNASRDPNDKTVDQHDMRFVDALDAKTSRNKCSSLSKVIGLDHESLRKFSNPESVLLLRVLLVRDRQGGAQRRGTRSKRIRPPIS